MNYRTTLRAALATTALGLAGLVSLQTVIQPALAQSATGAVSGQVIWSGCFRGPYPYGPGAMAPDGAAQSAPAAATAPDASAPQPDAATGPSVGTAAPVPNLAFPYRVIPAGAVLVAAEGTALSTRTDENGHFTLPGLPAGQYLMIAAGPVPAAGDAAAWRPNVLVTGGQSVDLGVLRLGSSPTLGIACPMSPAMGVPSAGSATGAPAGEATAEAVPAP